VTAADIQVFADGNGKQGNEKFLVTDVGAHMWYFNAISGCNTQGLELFK